MLTYPSHIRRELLDLRPDSIDHVVVDGQVGRFRRTDSLLDEVVDNVVLQGHALRVLNQDTSAQTARDGGVSYNLRASDGIIEPNAGEFSCLLRAVVHCNVVEIDGALPVGKVCAWVEEVRDEDLASVWLWVGRSHAQGVSARGDIDVAAESQDFTTHVDALVIVFCGLLSPEVVAFERLYEHHLTRL